MLILRGIVRPGSDHVNNDGALVRRHTAVMDTVACSMHGDQKNGTRLSKGYLLKRMELDSWRDTYFIDEHRRRTTLSMHSDHVKWLQVSCCVAPYSSFINANLLPWVSTDGKTTAYNALIKALVENVHCIPASKPCTMSWYQVVNVQCSAFIPTKKKRKKGGLYSG